MNPISNIQSLPPSRDTASIAGRVISSFGNEVNQLLAMTVEAAAGAASAGTASPAPAHLGANIDVRA